MILKQINLVERESTHLWPMFIVLFLNTNVLNWGVIYVKKWKFFEFKRFYSDFYHLNCKPLLHLWIQKRWRTHCRKLHWSWPSRRWEYVFFYEWSIFFTIFFKPYKWFKILKYCIHTNDLLYNSFFADSKKSIAMRLLEICSIIFYRCWYRDISYKRNRKGIGK